MGLGLIGGGVETVKWLVKEGAKVLVTDLKTKKELKHSLEKLKKLPVKYHLGKHFASDFKRPDLIIKNPGVSNNSPFLKIAKKNKIPIETDISLFFKLYQGQIIGITGTKGKSTTASLIYEILKSAGLPVKIGGNIGQSPLKYLNVKMLKRFNVIMVLELSSWQLESLAQDKISPKIAVITNIYPDHLNRYKNLSEYIEAKKNIFKYQKPDDFVILNYDCQILRKLIKKISGRLILFSQKSIPPIRANSGVVVFVKKDKIFLKNIKQKQKICSLKNIKLLGRHNLENILAAVAIASLYQIKPKIISQVLEKFSGLSNRLELIKIVKNIKYYNDTAATTPEATIAALKALTNNKTHTLDKKIILLAGGADKKLKFKKLAKIIRKKCRAVILFTGTASPKLKKQLSIINYHPIYEVGSMKEAVEKAKNLARPREIILLSPACASFGLFSPLEIRQKNILSKIRNKSLRNYVLNCKKQWGIKSLTGFKNEFDRGKQFKGVVRSL